MRKWWRRTGSPHNQRSEWKAEAAPSIQRLKQADRPRCLPRCVPADHILFIGLSKHYWAPSTSRLRQGLQGDLNTMRDHPNLPSGWDNEIVTGKTGLLSLCPLKFYCTLKAQLLFSPRSFPDALSTLSNCHLCNLSGSELLLAWVCACVYFNLFPTLFQQAFEAKVV